MGTLFYGAKRTAIDIDDTLLRHLEALFSAKLRRGEGFLLSWADDPAVSQGRTTVWVDSSIELQFRYGRVPSVELNDRLLDDLARAAVSGAGIRLSGGSVVAHSD